MIRLYEKAQKIGYLLAVLAGVATVHAADTLAIKALDIPVTGICFFDDSGEPADWCEPTKTAIKSSFLKALCSKAPHIFITPSIWTSYLNIRKKLLDTLQPFGIDNPTRQLSVEQGLVLHSVGNEIYDLGHSSRIDALYQHTNSNYSGFGIQELLCFDAADWDLYDTHTGLYYLQKKGALQVGIQTTHFKLLDPLNQEEPEQPFYDHWTDGLHYLFNVQAMELAAKNQKIAICIDGHGSERAFSEYQIEKVCGISAPQFAHFVKFLNDNCSISALAICSCYWPAQRVYDLMKNRYNYHFLSFMMISQTAVEDYVATRVGGYIEEYNPIERTIYFNNGAHNHTFYETIMTLMKKYNGVATREIQDMLLNFNDTDLQIPSYIIPGESI